MSPWHSEAHLEADVSDGLGSQSLDGKGLAGVGSVPALANGPASLGPGLSSKTLVLALVLGRGGPGLSVCKGTRPRLKTAKGCEVVCWDPPWDLHR